MNVNEKETTLTRAGSAATRKLVLTAMFTCLAFVLNTFVYFPAMAPFQHFVNVLAAALVIGLLPTSVLATGPANRPDPEYNRRSPEVGSFNAYTGTNTALYKEIRNAAAVRTGYRLHYRRHVRPHLRRLAVPEVRHLVVRVDRRDHRHRRHRRHGVLSPV